MFSGFRVTRPLVFCVVFCRWLFFLFSFGHFVVLCSQIFAPTVQKLVLKGTDRDTLETHRIVLPVCAECMRMGKTVPKRNPIK